MNNIIEANNITKTYGSAKNQVTAVNDISLYVKEREILGIIGPSGSGKSTLLNMLGCLDTPSNGVISIEGIEISGLSKDKRAEIRSEKIGFIFQQFNLILRLTALENVMLPLLLNEKYNSRKQEKALDLLGRVGLKKRLNHKPDELSGGEQQRVAIARALINDPLIIIADEPTGNIDTKTSKEIMDLIVELNSDGKTLIIATHSQDLSKLTHRLISLKDGKIV